MTPSRWQSGATDVVVVGAEELRGPMVDETPELASVAAALGTSLVSSEPMPWGDAGATWRLDLADGRRLVVRRFARAGEVRPEGIAAVMRSVAAGGVPVARAWSLTTDAAAWLVTEHLAGLVGVAWLDDHERARVLAAAMGRVRRRLLRVDPGWIAPPLPTPAATSRPPSVDVAAALAEARATLAHRRAGDAFVHGDFAPVNVILDEAGELRALLDFEHAHVGDPLEDVAWWGWVVRHHHPAAWEAAWPAFCAAAGVDQVQDARILRALMLRELGRRAAVASDRSVRDRWLARLTEAATW